MKFKELLSLSILGTGLVAGQAATLTVTTELNVDPPAGSLSLAQAMGQLQNGDIVTFNIPGEGPHFLLTPPGGYPVITADNVTIDGYSQPGSSPNSNPILSSNNASLRIVLDSRNGNASLMDFPGDSPNDQTGYGDTEAAVIGILEATNVTVRGVSILAVPLTQNANGDETAVYGFAFAKGSQGHVAGTWIGVAPDGTTVAGPADGITAFRYRVRDENSAVLSDILSQDIVVGVGKTATNAPAEFNIFLGIPAIPIIIEANSTRIAGNFLNVYPSGVRDFNPPLANPELFTGTFEGNIEIGRGGNNTVIGVDGDGVNDANERNIFSGVLPSSLGGYDHNIEFYGQNPGTNVVIAGNYFGIGVDGTTRFTNGAPVLNAAGGAAEYRFGSNFDGVSDSLEGNVAYNNWPVEMFPTVGTEGFFDELSTSAAVSARGNVLVNNFPFPVSAARTDGEGTFWQAYLAKSLADPTQGVVPIFNTNAAGSKLVGTVPLANADYPVTIIDVYVVDPEGLEYGQTAEAPEMTNGYIQGKTYLGSFTDNSAADADKTDGAFEIDLGSLGSGGNVTVAASYVSTSGLVITGPFSDPVNVGILSGSGATLTISAVTGSSLRLNWINGTAPFLVQRKSSVSDTNWMNVLTTSDQSALVPNDGTTGFFRIVNSATTTVIPINFFMDSSFEPGAVVSSGAGRGTVSLEGNKLSFDIKYGGLTGTATASHIHGFTNTTANAGVIIDLAPYNGGAYGISGRLAGSVELTEVQKAGLLEGETYVNIHTAANPGGEIRSQLYPSALRATLDGASETPAPIDTPATGTGKFTLVGDDLFVDVTYTGLKQAISNAHIHGPGAPGVGAGVLVDMVPLHTGTMNVSTSGGFLGRVTLNSTTLKHLIDGLTYFNIHSAAHPGGEIRGQIIP